jgi:tetratricopeptide (TPR) repeat protein
MIVVKLQMTPLRMHSHWLLAGTLAALVVLQARSQPAPYAKKTLPQQGAASAPKDDSLAHATLLMQQGKNEEALALLNSIVEAEPSRRGIVRQIGMANYRKGDYLKAAASFKKALDEDPNDNEAVQLMGLSYYLAGRPAEAITPLEQVQTWYPSANVDASYILGICYLQTKDYPNARKAFARMFGVPADSAAAYLFAARMLLRQDFTPVAEEYAKKAVELDPKLPRAHMLLGELCLYKSRIPEAVEQFQKELELNPGEAAVYYKLADAYSRLQKYEEAEKLLQRSIWLDATSTGPYILMGKVLEKKGETALAVRALQRAISMDPNNPMPHHLLGQAYRQLGKNEDADRELKIAAQLDQGQEAKP